MAQKSAYPPSPTVVNTFSKLLLCHPGDLCGFSVEFPFSPWRLQSYCDSREPSLMTESRDKEIQPDLTGNQRLSNLEIL